MSHVMALAATRMDAAGEAIILFGTLKQCRKRVFRAAPVPRTLLPLPTAHGIDRQYRL